MASMVAAVVAQRNLREKLLDVGRGFVGQFNQRIYHIDQLIANRFHCLKDFFLHEAADYECPSLMTCKNGVGPGNKGMLSSELSRSSGPSARPHTVTRSRSCRLPQ